MTTLNAADVASSLAVARRLFDSIGELWPEAEGRAYTSTVGDGPKAKIIGADPTGELATDSVTEDGHATELAHVRAQVDRAGDAVRAVVRDATRAVAALQSVVYPPATEYVVNGHGPSSSKVRRWTHAELAEEERRAFERVAAEDRLVRRRV